MSEPHDHPSSINRLQLLDWLLPACEPDRVALLYPKGKSGLSPGWVMNAEDAARAVAAYRAESLEAEVFQCRTKEGKAYEIRGAVRLGLVPHRDGHVQNFCIDFDDHAGDGGTVQHLEAIERFLGAKSVTFRSKGGGGLHCFYRLLEPVPVEEFVAWARAWGFNRAGEIEVFPKTAKNTQAWLPNEPNDKGGDAYVSGTFESCTVGELPPAPSARLTNTTLHFLLGLVRQPGRNDALNKAAYELASKGMDRSEAWTHCQRGARLCGLEAEEPQQTQTTFNSGFDAGAAASHQAQPETSANAPAPAYRRLDGIGNGERFIDQHGANVHYSYELERWMIWTGQRWSLDAQAQIDAMAKKSARLILQEMERSLSEAIAAGEDPKAIEIAYRKQYKAAASVIGVRDMLRMAESESGVGVRVSELDANPMLFNACNGTIDLTTGVLLPHQRADLITKVSPASYRPDAEYPHWMAFLDRIFDGDEELIAFIQRAVGYSLTGHVGEQCLFFLHGTGQNGKSVFVQTLLHVLGDYGQKAPTDLIMKQERASSGSASPDTARLRGARAVVTAELEEGQRLGEARVKDLTGSDRIVSRRLYCEPFEFDPSHKLWIYGNHKPVIRGTDHGIWRRIRLIPFAVTIPDNEKDRRLLEKLQRERDGILGWAVRGCLEWQRDGLGLPSSVARATEAYRSESDRLADFLEERCAIDQQSRVGKGDLFEAYEQWCEQSGERAVSKKRLGIQLAERGFKEERESRRRWWIGLALVEGGAVNAAA